jgi:hypothetical protein
MKEMVLKTHLDCWYNEFFLSCNVQVVWEVNVHRTYLFIYVFIYLFRYVCILWLGMTVYDFATLSSSEHVTELRWASTQDSIFSLLVVCCALVAVTDMNTYVIEEYLLVLGCIKLQHRSDSKSGDDTFSFSSDLGSHVCAEQLFQCGKKYIYVEEYEGFSSEQSTSIMNSDLCCDCHFHWMITTQFRA